MCLTIDKQLKAKIARRNFVVAKYLRPTSKKNIATSPYKHFNYTLGKEYSVKTGFSTRKSPYKKGHALNIGLHSFTKNARPGMRVKYYAIIPKGAFYIVGKNKDIISNRLIVKKRWKNTKKKV